MTIHRRKFLTAIGPGDRFKQRGRTGHVENTMSGSTVFRVSKRNSFSLKSTIAASALLAVTAFSSAAEAGERRVAFVIGNSDYSSVPKLPNPKNDAEAVAKALKRSGFEVVTAVDLDRQQFDAAFEKFVRSMQQADLSLFYYSGHGIQVGGDNRIIPVDAHLQSATDLEVETVSVETVMSYMQKNSKVQLVYLDSCRNNPFPSQSFLVGPEKQAAVAGIGLAPQKSDLGSLIAFSTQPGAIAVDGTGDKSPFTDAMVKQSFKLGVDVQTALTKVAKDVYDATSQKQKPWSSSTLPEPVFLAKPLIRIAAAQPELSNTAGLKIGAAKSQDVASNEQSSTATQIASLLGTTLSKPQRVPIGVGQVALLGDFPIIRAATGAQIEVTAAPKSGVMYLDGKPLGEGDVVDQDSLRKVTYEPSIGSEKASQSVEFKVAQAGSSSPEVVTGSIETFVLPCDVEAAEPLDLQGVASGKLPNEINPAAATDACKQAVQQYPNVARYKYQLGRAELAGKDVPAALDMFKQAAESGHTRAYYQLGYMAQRGLGRSQSIEEANELFRKASDAGDPYGMLSYGRNLVKGRGAEKNVEEGVALLNKAVEMGHTYAMNELGAMYYYGSGVGRNPKRGVRFYEASLARGDIYAMRNMAIAYLEGKGVSKDATTALALFQKASDGGHPSAPTDIGAMYYGGNGVKKDIATAISWYEKGAERGDTWAAGNLAWIYSKEPKVDHDQVKAAGFAGLAVALDTYSSNKKAKETLAALSAKDKATAVKQLVSEIGADNLETAGDVDTTLVMLSRKAWQMRNPRLDLF